MKLKNKMHIFAFKVALEVSKLSKDPSTKVGAVILSPDNRQFSIGYNGFAAGIEETAMEWNTREIKHEMVIHAEENALLNCPFETKGCSVFLTHQPCHKCLIRLLQSGIENVYYLQEYTKLGHFDIWLKHSRHFKEVLKVDLDLTQPNE